MQSSPAVEHTAGGHRRTEAGLLALVAPGLQRQGHRLRAAGTAQLAAPRDLPLRPLAAAVEAGAQPQSAAVQRWQAGQHLVEAGDQSWRAAQETVLQHLCQRLLVRQGFEGLH